MCDKNCCLVGEFIYNYDYFCKNNLINDSDNNDNNSINSDNSDDSENYDTYDKINKYYDILMNYEAFNNI